ncbi:MAG: exopolysaccharide biosynthesis polyprenyl glycosylphosphotransferase [Campylobacterota bacterium]|nr:exopolysaccharide biosynthesis polyprenyl glycosylphosphotransferase [Campylobacterota bacterium]
MKSNKLNSSLYLFSLLIICIDIFALSVSLEVTLLIRENLFSDTLPKLVNTDASTYYWIIIIILSVFIIENIYFIRYDFWQDTKKVLKGLSYSFLAVFTVISLTKISDDYSRAFIFIFFVISMLLIPFFKRIGKKILFLFDIFKIKVKVVSKSESYKTLQEEIKKNWYFGFKNDDKNYDMVIISSKKFDTKELQTIIKKYTNKTKDIYVVPYMEHLDFSHTSIVDYSNIRLSAIHIENRLLNSKNIFIKSLAEKITVISIFPLVLFVHVVISIFIKQGSKGSIIFKQKRLGKDSTSFSCYKYRTMYENSDVLLNNYLELNPNEKEYYKTYHKYQNDPRITKVGRFLRKTSLDEFPQFYNILRGDMSLIGPRPYMLNEKEAIGKLNEDVILKVKPGITGLWQVSGRNELTFKQRVDLDTWYIQNWSLWIDFVVFMKTIKVVLLKVGAR